MFNQNNPTHFIYRQGGILLKLSSSKAPESLVGYYLDQVDWLEIFRSGRLLTKHKVKAEMLKFIKEEDLANTIFKGQREIGLPAFNSYIYLINYGHNITQKFIEELYDEGQHFLFKDADYRFLVGQFLRENTLSFKSKSLVHDDTVMLNHLSRYKAFPMKMKEFLTEGLYRAKL